MVQPNVFMVFRSRALFEPVRRPRKGSITNAFLGIPARVGSPWSRPRRKVCPTPRFLRFFHGFGESPESSIFHCLEHVSRPDPFLGNPGTVRPINMECKFPWFARNAGCGTFEKSAGVVKSSIKWPPEHTFRCVPSSGSVGTARPINPEGENIMFDENCASANNFQKVELP